VTVWVSIYTATKGSADLRLFFKGSLHLPVEAISHIIVILKKVDQLSSRSLQAGFIVFYLTYVFFLPVKANAAAS